MNDAKAIARVVRSVVDTFKRREWKVTTCRSRKSRSRYIYARKGNRSLKVRVSDHRPSPSNKCDLSYSPRSYQQKRLAKYLDGKKTTYRLGRRRRS